MWACLDLSSSLHSEGWMDSLNRSTDSKPATCPKELMYAVEQHQLCTFWDLPTSPAVAAGIGSRSPQLLEKLSLFGWELRKSFPQIHPSSPLPHGSLPMRGTFPPAAALGGCGTPAPLWLAW